MLRLRPPHRCAGPPARLPGRTTSTTMPRRPASRAQASSSSFDPGPVPPAGDPRVSVLMVCLGNICRSPSAEAVFRAAVQKRGLSEAFWIDSCGTGGGSGGWYRDGGFSCHEGDPADPRMSRAAAGRGIALTSRSRPLTPADVSNCDYILVMDDANERAVATAAAHWAETGKFVDGGGGSGVDLAALPVRRLTSYLRDPALVRKHGAGGVPDPYYGGPQGFELVLDLLEDCCEGLLDAIVEEKGLAS
jgi:protein-tyrosine phosphatase